jgi:hypothetical protein
MAFIAEQVPALLDGRKTQTRRVMLPPDKVYERAVVSELHPYGRIGDVISAIIAEPLKPPFEILDFEDIKLKIKELRIEQVQDITPDEVRKEGVEPDWEGISKDDPHGEDNAYRAAFARHWDRLYAPMGHGWDKNPWVCVISFDRVPVTPDLADDNYMYRRRHAPEHREK